LNVVGYTTGKQKADPALGVRGLAVEFEAGKWLAPAHPDVDMWLSEARAFDPSAHTGDRLMASWLAKEGVRMFYEAHGKTTSAQSQVSVSRADAEAMFGW
jgi:hypothetical protein